MNLGEVVWWVVKLILVFAILTVLALFSRMIIPEVDYKPYLADTTAARVVYNGGFMTTPGIIDETKFTQAEADKHIIYPSGTAYKIYAIATVYDLNKAVLLDPIYYNNAGYRAYYLISARGFTLENRTLPAVIIRGNQREPVLLNVEVWYG